MPAVGGLIFQQATTLVDQAMAAHLVAGSVAALSYAYRLIALPLSLATLSIGTAILPVLSDLASRDDWSGFWRNAARWIRLSLWGGLVPAAALFAIATPLVELAYERGSFGSSDTAVVGAVLGAYTGMIPFYVAGIVGVRAFSILGLNRLLLTLGAVNLVTNVAGNLILARWFGVIGIALATVAVYLISAILILARLNRERRRARSGG
jgi:putative peptidoglycan lipid II flippase